MIAAKGGHESGLVLAVDDEPAIRAVIKRFLERTGHRVDTATSSEEAMEQLALTRYDVVLTDLKMTGATGLDLLEEIRSRWPETRTILMSGQAEAADAAIAIEHGIDRLLLKPFDLEVLRAAVERALAERRAQTNVAKDRNLLDEMARQRETTSRSWILRAAQALATAVEAKDSYTAGHAARVTAYALAIAEVTGGIDTTSFRLAGQLHDVGKIGVPDAVLNKPGKFTEQETSAIRKHPEIGTRILEPLIDDPIVIGVVRSHHERWDGHGYPDGLSGEETPLEARILAVADTLDAMSSNRAYRDGLPWDVALAEIRRCGGTQFDPGVVGAFERALPTLDGLRESFLRKAN